MVLRLFVGNFVLLVVDDDDEEGGVLHSLRIYGEHLLHSDVGLLLDLLVLAYYVCAGVELDDISKPQRLLEEPLLVVLVVEGHIVEEQFASLLEPAEMQAAEVVLAQLLTHECLT